MAANSNYYMRLSIISKLTRITPFDIWTILHIVEVTTQFHNCFIIHSKYF